MMLKVIGLQIDIAWEDRQSTFQRVDELVSRSAIDAGSLLVLPEMFDVGFTMNAALAVEGEHQTQQFVSQLARRTRCSVLAGFARPNSIGKPANVATLFDESGTELGRYEKNYPFSLAGEDRHYAAGSGPVIIDFKGIKLAPIVCYDLRFPELFRAATKQGAELFVVIANWPIARVEHWVTLARARAIENQAYVVAVNRCGTDPKLVYPGRSLIIDPKGVVLADAGDAAGSMSAMIDAEVVRTWRGEFPVLRDVRD